MSIFDDTIREVQDWFTRKESEGRVRRYEASLEARASSPRGACANSGIILKEDTHVELGHPSVGSCSVTLATHDASLVENGRITLVGPDIPETSEKMLPFAQIAVACCTYDIGDTSVTMDRVLHASAQVEGYMLRSVPDQIWARVSKEAARSGFSMRQLGWSLLNSLNNECPDITGSEIFFVTSNRAYISALKSIVDTARDKLRKLQTYERKPDGTYECTASLDCSECPEKPVCDNIREVITIRKGDRIITFGNKGGGDSR